MCGRPGGLMIFGLGGEGWRKGARVGRGLGGGQRVGRREGSRRVGTLPRAVLGFRVGLGLGRGRGACARGRAGTTGVWATDTLTGSKRGGDCARSSLDIRIAPGSATAGTGANPPPWLRRPRPGRARCQPVFSPADFQAFQGPRGHAERRDPRAASRRWVTGQVSPSFGLPAAWQMPRDGGGSPVIASQRRTGWPSPAGGIELAACAWLWAGGSPGREGGGEAGPVLCAHTVFSH